MEETRASKKQRTKPKDALEVLPGTFYEAVTRTEKEDEKEKKGLPLRTDLRGNRLYEETPCFSLDWFQWVCRSLEMKEYRTPEEWRDRQCFYDSDLMYLAAFQGSKKVMKWLVSHENVPLDIERWISDVAAASGSAGGDHLDVLKWLQSEGCEFDEDTCKYAARGGHLDVVKWARSQDPPCDWDPNQCRRDAEGNMHDDIVEWVENNRG